MVVEPSRLLNTLVSVLVVVAVVDEAEEERPDTTLLRREVASLEVEEVVVVPEVTQPLRASAQTVRTVINFFIIVLFYKYFK